MKPMDEQTSSVKFTYEDYLTFPDDGKRHEIIDGEHYVTPSPNTRHQKICANLHLLVGTFVREQTLGTVYFAPLDTLFSDLDVVQPDLLFVSTGRGEVITAKNISGAPDLVVEVLCEGTRRKDEVTKRKLYERFRVGEYWIVDPELETVKVHRLVGDSYERVAELSNEKGDVLTTPLLPGLELPLAEIFD
jgi:Uma2 family endonuclease